MQFGASPVVVPPCAEGLLRQNHPAASLSIPFSNGLVAFQSPIGVPFGRAFSCGTRSIQQATYKRKESSDFQPTRGLKSLLIIAGNGLLQPSESPLACIATGRPELGPMQLQQLTTFVVCNPRHSCIEALTQGVSWLDDGCSQLV